MKTYTVLLGTMPEYMAQRLYDIIEWNVKFKSDELALVIQNNKCMVFAKDTISEWQCSIIRHIIAVITHTLEEPDMEEIEPGLGLTVDNNTLTSMLLKDLSERSNNLPKNPMTPEEEAIYKSRFDEIKDYLDNKE